MRRFTARWDRSLRISTAFFLVLIAAIGVFTARAMVAAEAPGPLGGLVPALLLVTVALAWAWAPRDFVVDRHTRELRVERNLGAPVRIPLDDVRMVAPLPREALRRTWKVMGTAGVFGHYGRFRAPALGDFRLYATRRDGLVLVSTASTRFVLTPEPASAFVEALLAAAPGAHRGAPDAIATEAGSRRTHLWLLAALLAAIPLAVGAIAWSAWSRGPRAIAVRDGAVAIERNGAEDLEIPLGDVHAAEPLPAERLAGLVRSAGTSGFGVRYGRFWAPALGSFQLYGLTSRCQYVLLDTAAGPVVVTPDEPARFLAEVRRGMARPGH
ncbi:PH domain-containing protein [Anaeromyxobacter oryzae]|uniref:Bacterial Pleckstrin homology domain-containing protein n=1 Tax=Anaeromyxobacter oryzae TaxID=2918170 RepID=A0ABM7WQE9_9BACT|nr:PH domain-containing protein [Anaeromyxobacter oryzae]BDG01685.1 hypothetical protein AMOR_06810 [Anaeromyxobacter oryzae]